LDSREDLLGVEAHAARLPPAGAECYLTWFRNYDGPTMNPFEATQSNGRGDDLAELESPFNARNTSRDPAATVVPTTYLRVIVDV